MEWYNLITLIFSFLFSSGGIIYLLNLKYEKTKSAGLANQEVARAEDLNITNTEKIINLYDKLLGDSETLWNKKESHFLVEIENLNRKIENQTKLIEKQEVQINAQTKEIHKLTEILNKYTIEHLTLEKKIEHLESIIIANSNDLANMIKR
jgi:septal ring factor EnvC (AmiA/AmiB activator)